MKNLILTLILFASSNFIFAQDWFEIDINTTKNLKVIDFSSIQVGYIAGDSSALFKTTDGGISWEEVNHTGLVQNEVQGISEIQFLTDDIGFAVTSSSSGGVFKTVDGGLTWSILPDTITNGFCFFESIYMFDETNGVFGGSGCFSGSLIETIVNNEFVPSNINLFNGVYQSAVDMDFKDENVGLVATKSHYIYRTTDGGNVWDTIPVNLGNIDINGVRFINGDTCIASYESQGSTYGVLKSVDAGLTWTQDGASATFFYPNFYCVSNTDAGKAYVGAEPSFGGPGMIFSKESTGNWIYHEVAQPIYDIDTYGDDITFAVGDSGLVVVNKDPLLLSIEENEVFEAEISLYPNPASNELLVSSSDIITSIEILDANGRLIQSVAANGDKKALDISLLSKGLYWVNVYSDETRQTKKLVKN